MKNHYEDVIVNINVLNKHWSTKFPDVWGPVMPKNRHYTKFVGQSLKWAHGEEKKCINPAYENIDIDYHITNGGFRHFPNYKPISSKKLFTFGCSQTFGVGAPDEHTWSYLLANKLGSWQVQNYGMPAASSSQIARVCYQLITNLEKKDYPDVVYILFPELFRTEYIGNEGKNVFNNSIHLHISKYPSRKDVLQGSRYDDKDPFMYIDAPEDVKLSKNYSFYNYTSVMYSFFETVRAMKLIKEVLDSRNIPWFWYNWSFNFLALDRKVIETFFGTNTLLDENGLMFFMQSRKSKARDGAHMGVGYAEELSDAFLQLYKHYENIKYNNQQI